MAVSVQRGTKTLPASSSSITIVRGTDSGFDTTVTKARTRLRVTYRTAGTSINPFTDYSVAATLTDGDTITVSRSGTANDVEVAWELTQFEAGQLVAQYVTLTFTGTTTATAAISAASLGGGRWIEYLGMVTGQESHVRSTVNLVFDSTTQVGGTRTNATGTVTVQACVYEHVAATVQTVQQTLTANTETDHDETIASVDTAKTFVTGTVRCAGSGNIADSSWQCHLTSATNLRWSRQTGTSLTFTFTCFVVSFSDATAVQRATVTHADGTGTVNTTITAVTTTEASVTLGAMTVPALGRSAASAWGRALMTATLSSTTNVETIKGITATAAVQYVQVIQWGAAGGASAAVTGTLATGTKTQADVVEGGQTIILTLTGDTFVASGATFDAQRQAIINGLDAASSPATGWNTLVRDTLDVSAVVRTSDTIVTITLPAIAGYAITADEVITCTIPAAALTGAVAIESSPTITIHEGAVLSAYSGTTNASGVKTTDLTSDIAGTRVLTTALVNGTVVARTTTLPS